MDKSSLLPRYDIKDDGQDTIHITIDEDGDFGLNQAGIKGGMDYILMTPKQAEELHSILSIWLSSK